MVSVFEIYAKLFPRYSATEVQISLRERNFDIVLGKRLPNHETEIAPNGHSEQWISQPNLQLKIKTTVSKPYKANYRFRLFLHQMMLSCNCQQYLTYFFGVTPITDSHRYLDPNDTVGFGESGGRRGQKCPDLLPVMYPPTPPGLAVRPEVRCVDRVGCGGRCIQ